jgi:hypothetical protein
MAKKTFLLMGLVALAFAVAFPATAFASRTIAGRITAFTATSQSVQDREIGVVSLATAPAPPTKEKVATSDLLTARQLTALIATAKTPADHLKLQKHYLALAARYEAEAAEHVADAQAYRKNPTFLESKTRADREQRPIASDLRSSTVRPPRGLATWRQRTSTWPRRSRDRVRFRV